MTQLVASVSLAYVAGDDIALDFTVTLADVIVDITGMTPRFAIARNVSSVPLITTEDASAEVELTDPEYGVFQVTINRSLTSALFKTYRFRAQLEDAAGDRTTVARGFITFKPDIVINTET